jgi:hypothetical protein
LVWILYLLSWPFSLSWCQMLVFLGGVSVLPKLVGMTWCSIHWLEKSIYLIKNCLCAGKYDTDAISCRCEWEHQEASSTHHNFSQRSWYQVGFAPRIFLFRCLKGQTKAWNSLITSFSQISSPSTNSADIQWATFIVLLWSSLHNFIDILLQIICLQTLPDEIVHKNSPWYLSICVTSRCIWSVLMMMISLSHLVRDQGECH